MKGATRLSLFLARRLTLSSGNTHKSPAVKVAIAAVALSVAVMLVAVGVVMGFKREITEKVSAFNSDITLTLLQQTEGDYEYLVTLTPTLSSILDSLDFVSDYSVQTVSPMVLKTDDEFKGVYIKSLTDRRLAKFLAESLEAGAIPDYSHEKSTGKILISRKTADKLNLAKGSRIDAYFITDKIRVRRLEVAGIYNSHFDAYDDVYVYASPALVAEVSGISTRQGTTISVSTNDPANLDYNTQLLHQKLMDALMEGRLYYPYKVENVHTSGANFFHWLSLLDMNVAVVLVLMTMVACVTLVSGMLIMMADKKRFIALMRALGADTSLLRKVFIKLALRVALTGMIIGDIAGVGIIYLQQATHILPLDPDSYYIDFVPAEMSWLAFVALNIAILFISWLILILPARFAGKMAPAHILNRE